MDEVSIETEKIVRQVLARPHKEEKVASKTDRECFCLVFARFTRNTCQTALGKNHFSEEQKTKRPKGDVI